MRIIAIVGIWNFPGCYGPLWEHFEQAFLKQFPGSSFVFEELWFSPWQGKKMRDFAETIVKKYDDGGEEILFLGYSMGGVIATAITPKFKKTRVCKVVTVWAPHTFLWGFFSRMLGSSLQGISAPVVSCSASFDYFVLWGAKYPKAEKHIKVTCDHLLGLLFSKKPAETIAQAVRASM